MSVILCIFAPCFQVAKDDVSILSARQHGQRSIHLFSTPNKKNPSCLHYAQGCIKTITMANKFEEKIHNDLHQYLVGIGAVDQRLPQCPDVTDRWVSIGNSYIPDGAREYRNFPAASLGWMMFIGMAVAMMWDDEWEIYSQVDDLYLYMRDKRGYDSLDEYICEDVLMVRGEEYENIAQVVSECATRVNFDLIREQIEPGTKEAFDAYVTCLRQLYLFGMAMQLKRMGYHMERVR